MREIISQGQGSSAAWRSAISNNARLAVWNIMTARVQNPIPNFDSFAPAGEADNPRTQVNESSGVRRQVERLVVLSDEVMAEARQLIRQARNVFRGPAHRRHEGLGFQFVDDPRSNAYLANTVMQPTDVVFVKCEGRDTRRDLPMPAYDALAGGGSRTSDVGSSSAGNRTVEVTSNGMATTSERGGGGTDIVYEVPSQDEIMRDLREWASIAEQELGELLGVGRRQ